MSFTDVNKRVAKNTLLLYSRQLLILLVSLYTVRVVLNTLGVEDYGLYNVVSGVVTFFSFLSGTLASSTQRFFSYALGQNDKKNLEKIFSINILIYGLVGIISLILLESIGLWFVKDHLRVPAERHDAAIFIYNFSVLTFIATILSTPFIAIIIAHEEMKIYTYISIVEAFIKFGVVFLLFYLPFDKLKLYGVLIFCVSLVTSTLYIVISIKKYPECQFKNFFIDRVLLTEIIEFTGWTLYGQITIVSRNQAVTVLINQLFNPAAVAARAIATNISGLIGLFASNFNTGLYPAIIKAYSAKERDTMFSLIYNGSKGTFFLMWMLTLPLIFEMETILKIWLSEPPLETALFVKLSIIEVLINSTSLPLMTAARSPGKIRNYELILGSIQLATFFVTWFIFRLGAPVYFAFVVGIIVNIVMYIARLVIVSRLINMSIRGYFIKVFYPIFKVALISTIIILGFFLLKPVGYFFSISFFFINILISINCIYFIGLDKITREKVKVKIISSIKNIK